MKYHVNSHTGRAGQCRATKKGCPLGADTPHFDTKEEAKDFIEKSAKESNQTFKKMSKASEPIEYKKGMDLNALPEDYKKELIELLNERRSKGSEVASKPLEKVTAKTKPTAKDKVIRKSVTPKPAKKVTPSYVQNITPTIVDANFKGRLISDNPEEVVNEYINRKDFEALDYHVEHPGCGGCDGSGDDCCCRCATISHTPSSVDAEVLSKELYKELSGKGEHWDYKTRQTINDYDDVDLANIQRLKKAIVDGGMGSTHNWSVIVSGDYYGDELGGYEFDGDKDEVAKNITNAIKGINGEVTDDAFVSSSHSLKDDVEESTREFFSGGKYADAHDSIETNEYYPGCPGCSPDEYGYNDYCRCKTISSTPLRVDGDEMAQNLYNNLLKSKRTYGRKGDGSWGYEFDFNAEDKENIEKVKKVLDAHGVTDKDYWTVDSHGDYYGDEVSGYEFEGDLEKVYSDIKALANNS